MTFGNKTNAIFFLFFRFLKRFLDETDGEFLWVVCVGVNAITPFFFIFSGFFGSFLDETNGKWRVVVLMALGNKTNAIFFCF